MAAVVALLLLVVDGFVARPSTRGPPRRAVVPRAGDRFLCDAPTPSLLLDLDEFDREPRDVSTRAAVAAAVESSLFIHVRVSFSAPPSVGFWRDAAQPLAVLAFELPPGGAYLAMGLNNNWDADYFWARKLGQGARRPAPGIRLRAGPEGTELCWDQGGAEAAAGFAAAPPGAPPPRVAAQTGDGKFSEWCEFLSAGDEVDVVPFDALAALEQFGGKALGFRRSTRPPGAEPVVVEDILWDCFRQ
ncbi:hypothetical protein M885DRAFT_610127 [Pelagophyceae sp. CCMP2097]|nr:hypothetical protein M885DRAFT_610127 [Pelagophyceae sp. CCMP2097]